MTDETPIAWLALEKGTPVVTSDGADLGKVSEVVGDEQSAIFSGINISSGIFESDRFVPAELVAEITTEAVRVSFTESEAETRLTPPA